jgi:nucleoid DNA-binding protein
MLANEKWMRAHGAPRGDLKFPAAVPGPARIRPGRFNSLQRSQSSEPEGETLPLTQTQLAAAVADRAEVSKAEAKRVLTALDEIVLEELGNAQKVRLGGLVQLTVRVKPAQKSRKGRNPATGEEITIAAKPASVDLRARPLAKAKAALPSVQKARRRLAA